jgi:hypothetical protein
VKILLFTQKPGEIPKSRGAAYRGANGALLIGREFRKAQRAWRWWVVECESAQDGRELIDRARTRTDMGVERGTVGPAPDGRILEHGTAS